MPRIKRKRRRREIKYLVGSIFPTILEPVDFLLDLFHGVMILKVFVGLSCVQVFEPKNFIGFISWSYKNFKVFGLLNYANILKQKGDSYVFFFLIM
jgi:hypothetical protein